MSSKGKKLMAPTPEISSLVKSIHDIAEQSGFRIVDQVHFAGRAAQYEPVPERLEPKVKELLQRHHPNGLYSHQAQAIELVLDGQDVCLATPTASGKSLVFIAATVDL